MKVVTIKNLHDIEDYINLNYFGLKSNDNKKISAEDFKHNLIRNLEHYDQFSFIHETGDIFAAVKNGELLTTFPNDIWNNGPNYTINANEGFKVSNVMIRYIDVQGLSRQRAHETLKEVEHEIYVKGLTNYYKHIEVVASDKNHIEIKQLWEKEL